MHTRSPVRSAFSLLLTLSAAACGGDAGGESAPPSESVLDAGSVTDGGGGADSRGGDVVPHVEGIEEAKSSLARAEPGTANLTALGGDNRAFAFDLYREIASALKNTDKNLVFSPYSISTALAMTYAGARASTAAEMKTALHFALEPAALHEAFNAADRALGSRGQGQTGADGSPFRLNVSNSLWQQRGFSVVPTFLDVLAVNYGAPLYLADFAKEPEAARGAINEWVSQKTEKLITQVLPPDSIGKTTVFVLTNTVYFNAGWRSKFAKSATVAAPFTRSDGSQVSAPTMHAGGEFPYARGTNYQAAALPYASEELSFLAVLPDAGKLAEVEAALAPAWFDTLRASLGPASVSLALPKLDYGAATPLKDALTSLGMRAAFEPKDADFSGISPARVSISDVFHRAVIKVFEEGTIAAAATAVVGVDDGEPDWDHEVHFDRPFLFAIVDAPTGQVLFLGRVTDPTAK